MLKIVDSLSTCHITKWWAVWQTSLSFQPILCYAFEEITSDAGQPDSTQTTREHSSYSKTISEAW